MFKSPLKKATLRRVGMAALSPLSDREIERDPARALKIAQDAMRATVKAYDA